MIQSITFLSKFLMKSMAVAFFMAIAIPVLRAQDCKTSFEFLNTTSERAASMTGADYRLELKNLSDHAITYTLIVEDLRSEENALQEFSLKDFYLNPITTLSEDGKTYLLEIKAKEEKIFYVNVKVQEDEETTNKSLIILKALQCADFRMQKEITTSFSPFQ